MFDSTDNYTLKHNLTQHDSNQADIGNTRAGNVTNHCIVGFLDLFLIPAIFPFLSNIDFKYNQEINEESFINFLGIYIYPEQFGEPPTPRASPRVPYESNF